MASKFVVLAFFAVLVAGVLVQGQPGARGRGRRFYTFEFYQQFLLERSDTPSQYTVVEPVGPNFLGELDVFDAAITEGEELNSTEIGRAHGAVIYDDLSQPAWENIWTAVFNEGSDYANSTIVFRGYQLSTDVANPQPSTYAVVGGTGVFHCAKGTVYEEVVSATDELQTIHDIVEIFVSCE